MGSIRGSPNSSRNPYYEPTSRVHDTATRNLVNKCQDFANEETYNLPCMGKSLKRENFCGFQGFVENPDILPKSVQGNGKYQQIQSWECFTTII